MSTYDQQYRFEVGADPRFVADLGAADTEVDASGTPGIIVVDVSASGSRAQELIDRLRVSQDGDTVRLETPRVTTFLGLSPRLSVRVQVPARTSVDVETGSGGVRGRGELGRARVSTGSGHVDLDAAGDIELKTGSGHIAVARAGGVKARTGSGGIRVGSVASGLDATAGSGNVEIGDVAGTVDLTCGSGNIEVATLAGDARAKTGSGRVTLSRVTEGQVSVATGSGSIRIGIAEGTSAHLDVSTVSGRVRSELESVPAAGADDRTLMLRARAVSGSIDLVRAV